jgi:hypothetical protein
VHVVRRVPCERHLDDHTAAPEGTQPVDICVIAADHAAFFQTPHALPCRRNRQIDLFGKTRLRDASVLRKDAQNGEIVAVEFHGPD